MTATCALRKYLAPCHSHAMPATSPQLAPQSTARQLYELDAVPSPGHIRASYFEYIRVLRLHYITGRLAKSHSPSGWWKAARDIETTVTQTMECHIYNAFSLNFWSKIWVTFHHIRFWFWKFISLYEMSHELLDKVVKVSALIERIIGR